MVSSNCDPGRIRLPTEVKIHMLPHPLLLQQLFAHSSVRGGISGAYGAWLSLSAHLSRNGKVAAGASILASLCVLRFQTSADLEDVRLADFDRITTKILFLFGHI